MLDYWKERLADTTDSSPVSFEIELWCHQQQERRDRTLAETEAVIRELGGTVFGQSVTIPEIGFQALKAALPKETLRQWIEAFENGDDANTGFFDYREIRFFRPIGQCAVAIETGELDTPIATEDVSGLPLVAILDGHPLAHHRMLDNKLIIDDPDDFNSMYESPLEYRHGTAMASLVLHGDLNAATPLQRPVYLRPVLQPDPRARSFDRIDERIPGDIFPEDLILRAVRRMFENENGEPPAAPTVKVINISLGDEAKPFLHNLSSWGRLLDWLSWKYKVLFIVSAGNCYLPPVSHPKTDFSALSLDEQTAATISILNSSTRNRSLLTPADSINSLSIGARHSDAADVNVHPEFIDLLPLTDLMSPISSHGPGYRRSLKPEILFPGGRQLYHENHFNEIEPARQAIHGPGIRTASPGAPGQLNYSGYSCGTSNAAAIASNGAGRIYEMLLALDQSDPYRYDQITDSNIAALIKTLIVHGTFKGDAHALVEQILDNNLPNRKGKEHVSRFMGYGNCDISRVLECLFNRGTVIGCGEIPNGQMHEYLLPLPTCFDGLRELKRVILTVGWLSPVNYSHHEYRQAALSIVTPGMTILKPEIGVTHGENDHHQIERGTVIHAVYEGMTARKINDGTYLPIVIACEGKAGGLNYPVPYGIAATIEAVNNVNLPVYAQIRQQIEALVRTRVQSNAR